MTKRKLNSSQHKRSRANILRYMTSMVSCQKGPTRHAYAWQIGPFWQDTLDVSETLCDPYNVTAPGFSRILPWLWGIFWADVAVQSAPHQAAWNVYSLWWRHNERDSVSNHQPHDCLLNRLSKRRSKKISKFRVTGLCEGNSPETGEFPAQRASNAENVPMWWRHHSKSTACHKAVVSPLLWQWICYSHTASH